ncbi:hypothetical protein BOTBODRAFT_175473 [Botryobasidium botryosum FD-172 SS1]|uniref:Uncharacterized protein n=1 Tax=Botryobasidium botryosum (strain FD-172 SS1) TaxID=930990 RepID=A0A067MPE9_BOTB1|nr:hypothetical protein BOTBODRAFT_175473 [Botryobasidium botryosum FD-172 SS1]
MKQGGIRWESLKAIVPSLGTTPSSSSPVSRAPAPASTAAAAAAASSPSSTLASPTTASACSSPASVSVPATAATPAFASASSSVASSSSPPASPLPPTGAGHAAPQPRARESPSWLRNADGQLQSAYRAHKARYEALVARDPGLQRQRGAASATELLVLCRLRDAMIMAELARVEHRRAAELARIAAETISIEAHRRDNALTARMDLELVQDLWQLTARERAHLATVLLANARGGNA